MTNVSREFDVSIRTITRGVDKRLRWVYNASMNEFQKKKQMALKKRAFELYKENPSTRIVGAEIGKSHTWVANAVNELSTEERDTKLQN